MPSAYSSKKRREHVVARAPGRFRFDVGQIFIVIRLALIHLVFVLMLDKCTLQHPRPTIPGGQTG